MRDMAGQASDDDARVSVIIPTVSQAGHLEACLTSLAHARPACRVSTEVIVVLNGAAPDVRALAQSAVGPGVRVIDSAVNRGFGGGCRLGVRHSTAPAFVLLNDDVRVSDGWLDPLVDTLRDQPRAGAVAPRVLGSDGSIQEVGSIIWRDGTTRPFGRGLPSASVAWRWRRRVDYASACALLVRREAWDHVGGFDDRYHPAYYEDVDFCLGLTAAGYEIWVDPRADVVHAESASSAPAFKSFLFTRHHARLQERWREALATHVEAPADPAAVVEAERAAAARLEPSGPRVLVVDDRVPRHGLGSGFDRMADTLLDLAASGARVRLISAEHPPEFAPRLAAAGIAVLDGPPGPLLAREITDTDLVIASRPNNVARVADAMLELPPARRPRVAYDAEALYHRRLDRQAALAAGAVADDLRAQGDAWRQAEARAASCADVIVCVSDDEAAFFRAAGGAAVHVITPWLRQAMLTDASLHGRADIGFVAGWLAGDGSPNADALEWFATEVLPAIVDAVPWVRVRVTGRLPGSLRGLEGPHLRAEGFVDDLAGFYRHLRVAVAPLRFGAGVKLKTVEAVQYGVPVVATTVGAEGLTAWAPGMIAIHDRPEAFAEAVVARLLDTASWRAHRQAIEAGLRVAPAQPAWRDVLNLTSAGGADVVRAL
jgi:GT2 family glycosyltransferase